MTYLDAYQGLEAWLAAMATTVTRVNALFALKNPALVDISFPRTGCALVTISSLREGALEQPPAIVIELAGVSPDQDSPGGTLKSALVGDITIYDDAGSEADIRVKTLKWLQVLKEHLAHPSAVLGGNSRVWLTNIQPLLGGDESGEASEGNLNTMIIHADLRVPVAI